MKMKKIIFKILQLLSPIYGRARYARLVGVKIGQNCRIYISEWGSEPFLIEIGNEVTVTDGVKILTHDGATCLIKDNGQRFYSYAPVRIGDCVFIGVNSIIMPGLQICDSVVIGAGSVVTKSISRPGVYVGNPAKRICDFSTFEKNIKEHCHTDEIIEAPVSYKDRVMRFVREDNHGE